MHFFFLGLLVSVLVAVVVGQFTNVACSSKVTPQNVPKDPSVLWGTWYTIATCDKCTSPTNICSQVVYQPNDATNTRTNLTYMGSFQSTTGCFSDCPSGAQTQAFGVVSPQDLTNFDPPYRLDLDLGFAIIPSDVWILAAAGDGTTISAVVTSSCNIPSDAGTDANQQIFFLSRQPYLVPPVTFASLESMAQRAITNYDAYNITTVYQQQGWCNYAFSPTFTPTQTVSCSSEDSNTEWVLEAAIVACILSFLILSVVCYVFFLRKTKESLASSGLSSL